MNALGALVLAMFLTVVAIVVGIFTIALPFWILAGAAVLYYILAVALYWQNRFSKGEGDNESAGCRWDESRASSHVDSI